MPSLSAALLALALPAGATLPPPAPPDEARVAALDRARSAVRELLGTLKGALVARMAEAGPAGALDVCAQSAGSITAEVAARTGARLGRSSLRLRNPANRAPYWVQAWLERQGERPAEGVEGFERVEIEGDRWVARVLVPLAVQPPCLACHGPAEALGPDVREALARRYPEDRATGYAVGDLRGAAWAEVEVAAP